MGPPPISPRTYTLVLYTSPFRSARRDRESAPVDDRALAGRRDRLIAAVANDARRARHHRGILSVGRAESEHGRQRDGAAARPRQPDSGCAHFSTPASPMKSPFHPTAARPPKGIDRKSHV